MLHEYKRQNNDAMGTKHNLTRTTYFAFLRYTRVPLHGPAMFALHPRTLPVLLAGLLALFGIQPDLFGIVTHLRVRHGTVCRLLYASFGDARFRKHLLGFLLVGNRVGGHDFDWVGKGVRQLGQLQGKHHRLVGLRSLKTPANKANGGSRVLQEILEHGS